MNRYTAKLSGFISSRSEWFGCGFLVFVAGSAILLVVFKQTLPDWIAWLGGVFLLLFGGWAVLANWIIPFQKGGGSLIPFFGGLFTAAGVAIVPVESLNSFWWVPLFVDLGCVPLTVLTAGFLLYRAVFPGDDLAQP